MSVPQRSGRVSKFNLIVFCLLQSSVAGEDGKLQLKTFLSSVGRPIESFHPVVSLASYFPPNKSVIVFILRMKANDFVCSTYRKFFTLRR